MNVTALKTRYGLILQKVIAHALHNAGFTFREDWRYHPDCERPDFCIPDDDAPKYVIEVHQSDSYNSFRMKILRAFTAVAEAKIFFRNPITVNLIFGNPEEEIPEGNVRALSGFFDCTITPRNDAYYGNVVKVIEKEALKLAGRDEINVAQATTTLLERFRTEVDELSVLIKTSLKDAGVSLKFIPLWESERERRQTLKMPPFIGTSTYYRHGIIQSLLMSESHMEELFEKKDPNDCSKSVKDQLKITGLVTRQDTIDGEKLRLTDALDFLVNVENGKHYAKLCYEKINEDIGLYLFLEDLRNIPRRKAMVKEFYELLLGGREVLRSGLKECLSNDNYRGIQHTRAWVADFMPFILGESHNAFNRRMYRHPHYTQKTLGNPFSNMVIRSPRVCQDEHLIDQCVTVAIDCFYKACTESRIALTMIEQNEIEKTLIKFRIDASIHLQKLNPLYIVLEHVANKLGLICSYERTQSFLSDISNPSDPVGKYTVYQISNGKKTVLANAIAVTDHHGDDKSKEWAARRLATLYRFDDDKVTYSGFLEGVFVIDGEWDQKDINRLYYSGWTNVIRLNEIEQTLKNIFRK